jgi:UDP-N-acetylglucosamine 2-epimerase
MHGVTEEEDDNEGHIQLLVDYLASQPVPVVWIGSNNDTGATVIKRVITKSLRAEDKFYTNINRLDYLALLKHSIFLIGNSSSGILEAPSFGKPVINLGNRQKDRLRGKNVIDAEFECNSISNAVLIAQSKEFIDLAKNSPNPYGDGQSSERIIKILEQIEITPSLLNKQISY